MAAAGTLMLLLAVVAGYRMEAGIYELGISNIEEWHQEFKETLRMVQIYAPFLMKSKEFSPVYAVVSKSLKASPPSSPILLAKIDMSKEENKPLMDQYHASDLPYLCFFRAGSTDPIPYLGEYSAEAILEFLKKHLFTVIPLTEVEEYERISVEENPVSGLLLAVVESRESDLAHTFLQYAKENSGKFTYALVEDKGEFSARFDLNSEAVIVSRPVALLGKDDLAFRNITKAASLKHFSKQIERTYPTSISLWTHYTEDILLARGLPIITLFFDLDAKHNLPRVKYMANRLRRAVEKYFYFNEDDNKFVFTIADKGEYKEDLDRLQLTTNRAMLTIKTKEGKFFVLKETQLMVDDQKIKPEAITRFIDGYLSGKLSEYVRSEDVPEEELDRNVRTIVGQTFNSAIMEAKGPVLLLIYSSANPDATLHETYSHIGEALKAKEFLTVAKIEASLNHIPEHFTSHTYPKLLYLPTERKYKFFAFEEKAITVEAVVKFVEECVVKEKQEKDGEQPATEASKEPEENKEEQPAEAKKDL